MPYARCTVCFLPCNWLSGPPPWAAPGLTAPEASAFAVDGFWELLRIQLLDIAVLAGVHFLAKRPLPKVLAALFCGFGVAFALLAGAKLAAYIRLFGFTPRRVAAGWFLTVLLVWGVLLLVRVFKPIPAARIGIAVLAVSFVVLGCTDPDRRIAEATLTRWEQGTDPMLDTGVLSACGATQYSGEEKEPLLMSTTTRLVQDGWFIGAAWTIYTNCTILIEMTKLYIQPNWMLPTHYA